MLASVRVLLLACPPPPGVYVGNATGYSLLPAALCPGSNGTLLVFASWTARLARLELESTAASLRVVATSPARNASILLRGGILRPGPDCTHVLVTTRDGGGALISQRRLALGVRGGLQLAVSAGLWHETLIERQRDDSQREQF